jgi:hypothetical protein
MTQTPDNGSAAPDASATGAGNPHQRTLNGHPVRQRIGDILRRARPDTRLVAAATVAAVAVLIVGVRLRRSGGRLASRPVRSANPLSFRVYATREGLVGGTTANQHVITPRDHFVALPSRQALSPRGSNKYSVKVCADNGRCETAPVWDVGPWNTTDDYWKPSISRQRWNDLPQGKPEAQAAYQDGYNGGKSGKGKQVTNPAGIDLADGTFWDGLGLTNNAWVTVTYLWT